MIGIFALLALAMFFVVKFCKKTLKNVLAIVIVLAAIYCSIISIDMNRVLTFREPIFVVPVNTAYDGGSGEYRGLGYKVTMEVEITAEYGKVIKRIEMFMFGKCIAGAVE